LALFASEKPLRGLRVFSEDEKPGRWYDSYAGTLRREGEYAKIADAARDGDASVLGWRQATRFAGDPVA
jgi:hypothetical protein